MDVRSANEVLSDLQSNLGEAFGADLHALTLRVHNLVATHQMWRALYVTSEQRLDLMNKANGRFFKVLHGILHENIILNVCKLTDPAETQFRHGTVRNLSLAGLKDHLTPEIRQKFDDFLSDCQSRSTFARQLRNKVIAHLDYNSAMGLSVVSESSAAELGQAVASIVRLMEFVHLSCMRVDFRFELSAQRGNELEVLELLYRGLHQRDREQQDIAGAAGDKKLELHRCALNIPSFIYSER